MVGARGIPANYSGIEVAVEEISARMVSRGHRVIVCCRISDNKQKTYRGIERLVMPTLETKHLGTIIHVFLSTLCLLFKKVDIVHYHALGPSIFAFLPRLLGKKTVVTIHALDWQRKKWGNIARKFLKMCEYSSIFFPNITIVVSNIQKKYFETKYRKKVYFVPNGAKTLLNGKVERLSKYGLKENNYILFVGRLVPEKGIHYLIKAFNEIKTDLKLVIVGSSSFTDKYEKSLKAMSNPQVKFLGFIPNKKLKELHDNAFLFVLPSEIEGAPISLLNAMSYGKCVLTSDIPECREIVKDYGFFFKARDYKDLKKQLLRLIDNQRAVKDMGVKAKLHIAKRYNWDRIADMFEKIYIWA